MKNWVKREKYVIMHGQSVLFRIIKWIIFIIVGTLLYVFFGWKILGLVVLVLATAGIAAHFLFRWKTHGWTKNWGLYKVIKTPFDEKL
jgi:hypothetical protein